MINRPNYRKFRGKPFTTGQYDKGYPNPVQKSKGISPMIIVVLVVFGLIILYFLTQSGMTSLPLKGASLYNVGYDIGHSYYLWRAQLGIELGIVVPEEIEKQKIGDMIEARLGVRNLARCTPEEKIQYLKGFEAGESKAIQEKFEKEFEKLKQ